MEINYRLTEEDYINFNLYHVKNSKTAKRILNIQRFILPLFFIIIPYFISKSGDTSLFGLFVAYLLFSILWMIFYPKYFYHYIIRNAKKMIKEGKNDDLLGEHQMVLSDDGIIDSTVNSKTEVTWTGIKNFKEDNQYIFLYNSSMSAYILPKRELDDVEEIITYVKLKLNKEKME